MSEQESLYPDMAGKEREELLQLLESYLKAIDVNIICSVTDIGGTIIYANDKFCEVSKYARQELIGQNHRIINSGWHLSSFFKNMWETIRSGKTWHDEIQNKAKDGTVYWVDTVILPIYDSGRKIQQYFSLRTLITEKKIAEQQILEYNKKLNEMLHMISHRVRAPLASCLGLMGLVDAGKITSKEDLQKVALHLKSSALELDSFMKELTYFVSDLEKQYDKD